MRDIFVVGKFVNSAGNSEIESGYYASRDSARDHIDKTVKHEVDYARQRDEKITTAKKEVARLINNGVIKVFPSPKDDTMIRIPHTAETKDMVELFCRPASYAVFASDYSEMPGLEYTETITKASDPQFKVESGINEDQLRNPYFVRKLAPAEEGLCYGVIWNIGGLVGWSFISSKEAEILENTGNDFCQYYYKGYSNPPLNAMDRYTVLDAAEAKSILLTLHNINTTGNERAEIINSFFANAANRAK